MCGRFAFYSPAEAAAELFSATLRAQFDPRYNIAPTQLVPAIRLNRDEERKIDGLRWGLIPSWAKDPAIGNRMINARAETVREKPAYRAAYQRRRCAVLADGFFEWRTKDGTKTPWFISLADGQPFAFGGLWERWNDPDSGEVIDSATLITTTANAFLEDIHHRMPMILTPETVEPWLSGDDDLIDNVHAITPELSAWPVSRRVNNARNDGEELVEPAKADAD